MLKAATEGPAELDEVVQIMMKEDLIDSDLKDYLDSLITTEVSYTQLLCLDSARRIICRGNGHVRGKA